MISQMLIECKRSFPIGNVNASWTMPPMPVSAPLESALMFYTLPGSAHGKTGNLWLWDTISGRVLNLEI